ncbi:MAG: YARHG domain-containing protein [Clostridia bacterium]|nr:YARHG domain-containing protein [Clostridia bacterium]
MSKRITALISCVLIACLAFSAVAEPVQALYSTHGSFAATVYDMVYSGIDTGSEYSLYSIDTAGTLPADMTEVTSAGAIEELLEHDGILYFIQSDGDNQSIMTIDAEGTLSTLSQFEVDVEIHNLSWYDDVLYVIANSRLYIVDPYNGEAILLCEELLDDYVIVDGTIYYISASDTFTYERVDPNDSASTISQTSGAIWSMSDIGTNPQRIVDKGVTSLRAHSGNLYFHNLEDNYIMGTGDNLWLEGKIYRYNIETSQMSSCNIPYDWDYYPTDSGLVVYSSQDISIYPLTGGDRTSLMNPELSATIVASGDTALVYEYDSARLSRLALDGSGTTVLSQDDILAAQTSDSTGDETSTRTTTTTTTSTSSSTSVVDQTYDDETNTVSPGNSSTYIFPNSSIQRLTREQIQMVDKSLWGYARNEIYARHGYQYTSGKYGEYFNSKTWYTPGGFSTSSLNSVEWANMELFKEMEREEGLISGSSVKSSSSSTKSGKNNYYILKEASSRRLTKKYLRNKLGSKSRYALARNEILARHGYVFKTKKYRNYFNNQAWYSPGGYSSSKVSSIEWYNIEQLKELEAGG